METCRICQVIQTGVKIEGKLCVIIELDKVLIATTKTHIDSCDADVVAEAVDLLRECGSKGSLIESGDVGHWGITFVGSSDFPASSRTRDT